MANTSNWKQYEKEVAEALGGKRVHRTMGSFATECPDVRFTKKQRRLNPKLKLVAVECKKRKYLNVHDLFMETKFRYGKSGTHIILATKIPATKKGIKKFVVLKKKLAKRFGLETKKAQKRIKLKAFIAPLVTVELHFFKELWEAWIKEN